MTIGITRQASTTPREWIRRCAAWDSLTLAALCMADMLSTLYWVHTGDARESNPMLAECLRRGYGVFCAQKIASFLPLILFCAYYRSRRPRLIALALRGTVVLYILFYAAAVIAASYF